MLARKQTRTPARFGARTIRALAVAADLDPRTVLTALAGCGLDDSRRRVADAARRLGIELAPDGEQKKEASRTVTNGQTAAPLFVGTSSGHERERA